VQRIIDNRRGYARDAMASNGITQIKGKAHTISLMPGKQRLIIENPDLIPEDYKIRIPAQFIEARDVPNENAIKAGLEMGHEIPGARLVNGEQFIQVR
jgi:hypothetical protein